MGGISLKENKQIDKSDIISRLKKIEGQVKGIQKMIEEEKCCNDVMIQVSAIRSAINRVGGIIMDKYIHECMESNIRNAIANGTENQQIDEMIETIVKYVK
jgi:DNA-binding FrmR family transcriptional regulator